MCAVNLLVAKLPREDCTYVTVLLLLTAATKDFGLVYVKPMVCAYVEVIG